jgi:hypothetical protein
MTRRGALALVVALLAAGCQSAPTPAPIKAEQRVDVVSEAERAFTLRDWAAAAPFLRQAIGRDPDNTALHYRLAICASWLENRDEATREFTWVLEHAVESSEPHQTARGWLTEAGVLARESQLAEATKKPEQAMDGNAPKGVGVLTGRVLWAEVGEQPMLQKRLQLHLMGVASSPSQGSSYMIRTDENGRYEFKGVVPGTYKLTNAIAVQPKWRMKIEVGPESKGELDLTPSNSISVRDDFPS